MKKITLKISAFLLLTMFALQVQGQVWTENGTYKISTSGLTPELFMTIDGNTGDLVWAAELPGENPTQVWTITDHRLPSATGYMEITANIPGVGDFSMAADQASISGKDIRVTVIPGLPIGDASDSNYGYDQFQRRRTSGFGGPGNDALFLKVPGEGGSRYGVIPAAAGENVQFDGGGIDQLKFYLISTLNTADFDTSSIFVSNPVNNSLLIKGLPSDVKQISVYSLLGQEVISREVNSESVELDVNVLTSGMYLIEISGETGKFTKKIIKQ